MCKIADQILPFCKLWHDNILALELVDALDIRAHNNPIGPAAEADLCGNHHIKLSAIDRQDIDGGRARGHFALIQRGPAFLLTQLDFQLEAVLLLEV